jgi:hypothetical protein
MRWRKLAIFVLAGLLPAMWIVRDLSAPVRNDLRSFDPHEVARMETAMWRSYYGHRPVRLVAEVATLLRSEYHLPFWRAYVAAWHAGRGAVVFQRGRKRAEYERALPDVEAFYRIVRAASTEPFDEREAARLELEWWIVHRDRDPARLERALAELEAAIYHEPSGRFELYARARGEAMILRDTRAGGGGVSEADWARIAGLLDQSWTALHQAIQQPRAD